MQRDAENISSRLTRRCSRRPARIGSSSDEVTLAPIAADRQAVRQTEFTVDHGLGVRDESRYSKPEISVRLDKSFRVDKVVDRVAKIRT